MGVVHVASGAVGPDLDSLDVYSVLEELLGLLALHLRDEECGPVGALCEHVSYLLPVRHHPEDLVEMVGVAPLGREAEVIVTQDTSLV